MEKAIGFLVEEGAILPTRATEGSEGWDIYSPVDVDIPAGERVLIKTGLRADIPAGIYIDLRPRSGLALKHGITVLNSPGLIDSDYVDEIGVIIINHGKEDISVRKGDRIAQFVFCYSSGIDVNLIDRIGKEGRNGGYGSTGR